MLVDSTTADGGHLIPDVEGLTIVYQPDGTGYLMASSQAASNTRNNYAVYERQGANAFIRTFKVVDGPTVDGCGRTDGIDAFAGDLGPSFPKGMFVCQDNNNTTPDTAGPSTRTSSSCRSSASSAWPVLAEVTVTPTPDSWPGDAGRCGRSCRRRAAGARRAQRPARAS